MTSGYSSTPLAKKLSLKDGMRVWFLDMPDSVRSEIEGSDLTLSEIGIEWNIISQPCAK